MMREKEMENCESELASVAAIAEIELADSLGRKFRL